MRNAVRAAFYVTVAIWTVAALYGAYGITRYALQQLMAPRATEVEQRSTTWSPIYAFAAACLSRLPSGATVVLLDPTVTAVGVSSLPSDRGPAAYGAPADVDWPNEATLDYVAYPHPLSVMGRVPDGWTPLPSGADYVAVWAQNSFRSDAVRAEARAAVNAVGQAVPADRRCEFSDKAGDAGVVAALGPRSVSFVAAPRVAAPPGLSARSLLLALMGIASLWLIGLLVLAPARPVLSGPLSAGMALPAGAAAVAFEMLVFSIAGARWSIAFLLAPWLLPAVVLGVSQRRKLAGWMPGPAVLRVLDQGASVRPAEWLGLAALVAWTLLVTVPAPLGLPFSDGFDFYFFKARAFFADAGVVPYYSNAGHLLFSLPAHPPLVPLAVTWIYLFIGGVEEHAALLLWPALYLSLVVAMFGFLRTRTSRAAAIWYTLALALIATELAKSAAQPSFTDLPLALYLFLAVASLWRRSSGRRPEATWLVVGGIFLAAAALTKEEGLVASIVVLVASLLLPAPHSRGPVRWWPSFVTGAVWFVAVSPWIYLRLRHTLPVETVSLTSSLRSIVARVPVIAVGLAERSAVHVAPAAALVAALWAARSVARKDLRTLVSKRGLFLTLVLVGQLAGDAAGLATSRVEVHLQLQIAGTRLISQLLPIFLFAIYWAWVALAGELAELGLLAGRLRASAASLLAEEVRGGGAT